MTTTPIGPAAPAVDQGAPGAASAGGGDVFLALVQGLLDAQQAPASALAGVPGATTGAAEAVDGLPAVDPATDQSADQAADPAGDQTGDQAGDLAQLINTAFLSPLVPGLVAALASTPVPAATAQQPGDLATVTETTAGVDGVEGIGGAATGAGTAAHAGAVDTASTTSPAPSPEPQRHQAAAPAEAAASEPATSNDVPAASAPGAGSTSASTPAPTPAGVTAAPVVSGPAAPTAPTGTATAQPTGPVAHQVFPEVVRLTTNPTGPQRVTVRLNPENLGEVRVVLTERRGTLEVSLSAGTDARRALVEGTPELQRLLDAVGRGDSRIVVRDTTGLPVAAPTPGSTSGQSGQIGTGSSWSSDLAGGAGAGGQTASGQGRDRTPAGNATPDPMRAAAGSSPATETITRARAGLDVTM